MPSNTHTGHYLRGLDSVRFVAALWVMMGHGALPPLTAGFDSAWHWARLFNGFWSGVISGPSAVILFFVVSGFCIHLPYAQGKPMSLGEFFARRLLRITIPMAAAILLYRSLPGIDHGPDWLAGVPAWSLVCELIYYGLYPFLSRISSRVSFLLQFQVAFAAALLLALTKPLANVNYPAWGYSLDWVVGLPCWLLGVVLATQFNSIGNTPSREILWSFRLAAVALGALTHTLALQQIVGQHLTLNFFALFCFVWLKQELAFYRDSNSPWAVLEWGGGWSYSLYLIHGTAFWAIHQMKVPMFGHVANWLITMSWVLFVSYVFYLICEYPSHRFARMVGSYFRDTACKR